MRTRVTFYIDADELSEHETDAVYDNVATFFQGYDVEIEEGLPDPKPVKGGPRKKKPKK